MKRDRLSELPISESKLFNSIIGSGKKEFLKFLTLQRGMLFWLQTGTDENEICFTVWNCSVCEGTDD